MADPSATVGRDERASAAPARRIFDRLLETVSAVLLLSLTFVVSAEVVARNLLNVSIHWTTDISVLLLQYVVFFGGFIASVTGGHLRIGLLADQLPSGPKLALETAVRLVGICFLVVALYSGWLLLSYLHGARLPTLPIRQSYAIGVLIGLLGLMLAAEAWWLARLARRR